MVWQRCRWLDRLCGYGSGAYVFGDEI
ncbi:hypothetical protein NC652_037809 [Populus alba x Populus x berolinensis]|uniref:Uncharacterized protein n=1 Tax=Populus alba x Populus x berolinensis TaxID=444605 RepID=A0AAD6PSD5_9ROSI|nr:hypothetical protein NC652_037809 [Populus alba x Populus x berolinensis]KAJ6959458.1 hypothetical protein NC653_037714 [Populus alba x Populus x berolinensis]